MILFMSNKGLGFVRAHLVSTIIFAILYYISDLVILYKPTLSKRLGLGSIKQAQTLPYYFYYSLITQSTVGYQGGKGEGGFEQVGSVLFKTLNLIQIIGIFVITGYFF